jgi:hypothetical protein
MLADGRPDAGDRRGFQRVRAPLRVHPFAYPGGGQGPVDDLGSSGHCGFNDGVVAGAVRAAVPVLATPAVTAHVATRVLEHLQSSDLLQAGGAPGGWARHPLVQIRVAAELGQPVHQQQRSARARPDFARPSARPPDRHAPRPRPQGLAPRPPRPRPIRRHRRPLHPHRHRDDRRPARQADRTLARGNQRPGMATRSAAPNHARPCPPRRLAGPVPRRRHDRPRERSRKRRSQMRSQRA